MTQFQTHALSLDLNQDTLSFLFPQAADTKNNKEITERIRSAFNNLNGVIQTMSIAESKIKLTWQDDLSKPDNLGKIAAMLTEGNYVDGIVL